MIMIELITTNYTECAKVVSLVSQSHHLGPHMIHVSKDSESAANQIEKLDNLTEMQMTI